MYSINLNNVANNNTVKYTDYPLLTCFFLSSCKVVTLYNNISQSIR